MVRKLGWVLVCLTFSAASASAKEKLILDGAGSDALRRAKIEVWRVEARGERKLAHQGSAEKALRGEVELPDGTYEIYLEDQRTGLIHRLDDHGKGLKIGKDKPARVDASPFLQRIQEIKERDKREQQAKVELLKNVARKGAPSPGESGEAGPAPGANVELHAPGELLVRFQPETTLRDRHAVMHELEAESRGKLTPLDVYRVKVSDTADLPALIRAHAGDPRVRFMEMNMTMSVPEPVEERR